MDESVGKVIRYWRESLLDADLSDLQLTDDNHVRVSEGVLRGGRLDSTVTEDLFKRVSVAAGGADPPTETEAIPVVVAPFVAVKKRSGEYGDRQFICPVLIPALLNSEGYLEADPNNNTPWIPRKLLEPTNFNLVLGSVDIFTSYLDSYRPIDAADPQIGWQELEAYTRAMFTAVAGSHWQETFENWGYCIEKEAALLPISVMRGMSANIIRVYDELRETGDYPPLLEKYVQLNPPRPRAPLDELKWAHPAKLHLGSFRNEFALSPSQRQALHHFLMLPKNGILAISGPPGTGKTTLLHSVIASLWVKAALEGTPPPVIVASSTNNQAVTNIIDSLSESSNFERWIDVGSFGLYLVNSRDKIADAKKRGILTVNRYGNGFPATVQTIDFIRTARAEYMTNCASYFGTEINNLQEALSLLQGLLIDEEGFLNEGVNSAFLLFETKELVAENERKFGSLDSQIARIRSELPIVLEEIATWQRSKKAWESFQAEEPRLFRLLDDEDDFVSPKSQMTETGLGETAILEEFTQWQEIEASWKAYQAKEPRYYQWLSFLPFIKRKREERLRRFLIDSVPTVVPLVRRKKEERLQTFLSKSLTQFDASDDEAYVTETISEQLKAAESTAELLHETLISLEKMSGKLKSYTNRWEDWKEIKNAADLDIDQLFDLETSDGDANPACLFNWLDTNLRFELFELATHYWEGRWLQTIIASKLGQPGSKESRNRAAQVKKWRRYAMLTPCFVTTMHSGPGFFDYYDGETHRLTDYIDLLIVDEAGQVTPEVSGGMFALAKQALVVGDVLQIEPVWSVPQQVDLGNLRRFGLLRSDNSRDILDDKGIMASSGSVMQMAQSVSPYQLPADDEGQYERGMFLAEHRRCVPEVIAYCNELAYQGRLRPMRPPVKDYPWPHMGYVHVKGSSSKENGSRKNEREARALVSWIVENKLDLESYYSEKAKKPVGIENIIGIVTPFAAQKRTIRSMLKRSNISLSKVGTVHALQGGERPMVLFSPVYDGRDDGRYFFDQGPNMLNVAVSRAKDSFLVFGDMDIFDPATSAPSGILARYLFADEGNEIGNFAPPSRVESGYEGAKLTRVNTLNRHVEALERAFAKAEEQLIIVSPYLRWRAVEADRVAQMTAGAVGRGVKVTIYVDDGFNNMLKQPSAARAAGALRASGADIKICHNIHSKVICIDREIFIEGSFNWLSAERTRSEYMRYETSMIYMGPQSARFIGETVRELDAAVIEA